MNRSPDTAASSAMARWIRWTIVLGVAVGVLAVAAMLLPGPAYRSGVLGLMPAFGLMRYAVWLGAAAVAISLLGLLLAMFARVASGRWRALLGIALGVAALTPPLWFVHNAKSVPPIHDISTDTIDPPAFQSLLRERADTPNPPVWGGAEVAAQQHATYPDIQPLRFAATPAAVFAAALATAHAMGWRIDAQVPAEGRIEATATTRWFGFKDDIVIRVRGEDTQSRLDIRSQSRVGRSDVGANAARIRAFRERLERRVAPAAR